MHPACARRLAAPGSQAHSAWEARLTTLCPADVEECQEDKEAAAGPPPSSSFSQEASSTPDSASDLAAAPREPPALPSLSRGFKALRGPLGALSSRSRA